MMFTWNLNISLPDNFPLSLKYSFLVKTLDQKTTIPNEDFGGFDYCSGYAPGCVFKEYCSCLKLWNEAPGEDMNMMTDNDDPDSLPF